MKKFKVGVIKRGYVNGTIEIRAKSALDAFIAVDAAIDEGKLQTVDPAIEWHGDYEYEDDTFETTSISEEVRPDA